MKSEFTGGWWLYSGLSADQLGAKLHQHDAYISDLEADTSNSNLTFSAILLKNSQTTAWWYFGLSGAEVGAKLEAHNAVPISLSAYQDGNQVKFAVSMKRKLGQAYWWYFGLTADQLGAKFSQHAAMPVDISAYHIGDELRFAVVMIPQNSNASWWWFGQTAFDIGTHLRETGGQLDVLRSYQTSSGNRYVVSIRKPASPSSWFWYFGQTVEDIFINARINGTFVSNLTMYMEGSSRRYACIMHPRTFDSENLDQHAKIRTMLRASHSGGWDGFYLRKIGGSVIQAFNETTVFDPASAMKLCVYTTAMRAVQDGKSINGSVVTLDTIIPVPTGIGTLPRPKGTDCPFDEKNTDIYDQLPLKLSDAMESMMMRSSNPPTEAIRRYFGIAETAATIERLGMVNTRHNGPTGCVRNESTLIDFGNLCEQVSQTYLDSIHWSAFRAHSLSDPLNEVVHICRSIAVNNGLPSNFGDLYRARMLSVYKDGRGGDSVEKKCVVGYISIPFCVAGKIVQREYVYGVFVDHADSEKLDDDFNQKLIVGEMMRDEINSSVLSFVNSSCSI